MPKLAAHGGASGKGPPWSIAASALPKGASVVTSNEAKPWMPRPGMAPVLLERGKCREIIQAEGIRWKSLQKKKTVLNLASRMGFEFLARNRTKKHQKIVEDPTKRRNGLIFIAT